MPDWAATGEMLQGIGQIASAIAIGGAGLIGITTFSSWKRQKIAERHLEQAEQILTASYKSRRSLAQVRAPLMLGYELSAAEETLKAAANWGDVPEDRQKRLTTTQAYLNRLNRTKDERLEVERLQPVARALFGADLEKAMEDLNHQFWVVQVDAEAYADDDGSDAEFSIGLRRNMWGTGGTPERPDPISDKVNDAIGRIEETCLPVLRLSTSKAAQKG